VSDTFRRAGFCCVCAADLRYGEMAAVEGVEENRRARGRLCMAFLAALVECSMAVVVDFMHQPLIQWLLKVLEVV